MLVLELLAGVQFSHALQVAVSAANGLTTVLVWLVSPLASQVGAGTSASPLKTLVSTLLVGDQALQAAVSAADGLTILVSVVPNAVEANLANSSLGNH